MITLDTISEAVRPRTLRREAPTAFAPWCDADLWQGIPPEYHGAELAPAIRSALAARPVSLALVGPPGTGKTRTLWALVHEGRRHACAGLMGQPVSPAQSRDGMPLGRAGSVAAAIAGTERGRVITEAGDIRARRYDRDWLTEQTTFPGWLCVDDVGCITPNEWVQESLYHLANERRAHGRRTIWTSNLGADGVRSAFGPAIASRLLGGEVLEIAGHDRRLA